MADRKKTPRRGGGITGDKVRRTYLGTSPVAPAAVQFSAEQEELLAEVYDLLKGDPVERDLKFRFLMAKNSSTNGKKVKNADAMLAADPEAKRTRKSASEEGCRLDRQIKSELGERGNAAIRGVSFRRIVDTLDGGHDAMFVKEFIARDGTIVQAPARPDWAMRLRAAELSMRLLGIGKEKESAGPVVVNVISYAPLSGPGSLRDDPWPGGGRGSLPVATAPLALPLPTKTVAYNPAKTIDVSPADVRVGRDD